jgi:glutathione synthase/RimK-type ligase-like ATP-grasp enzyme
MPAPCSQFDVTLVTHAALPEGAADDQHLAAALRDEGLGVRLAVWNDPSVDWHASKLAVVRSTWDYHREPQAWALWLAEAGTRTRLLNPPALLAWNTDKRYLRDLQAAGVACVPTWFVEHGATPMLPRHGINDWIVKPAIGASARAVRRFAAEEFARHGLEYARALATEGAVLLQPYLKEVETVLERSLVFIAGEWSHAFTKPAFSTDAAGRTAVQPYTPSVAELRSAQTALAAVPTPTLYARIDLVPTQDGPLLMELELIEPDLALRLHPLAAASLASACRRTLGAAEG